MNCYFHSIRLLLVAAIACLVTLAMPARAQDGKQTVTLVAGWNSVWLEVEPYYLAGHPKAGQPKSPEDVFDLTPTTSIEIIATPRPLAGLSEFFGDDPTLDDETDTEETGNDGTVPFNEGDEWQVWTKGETTNNLPLVFGNRPYLIKTTTAVQFPNLTGKARFFRPAWTPGRYNLVGFALEGTPKFADFFRPSGGKHILSEVSGTSVVPRMYKLNATDGSWVAVTADDTMQSNTAYWIFSKGTSNYMGPVAVDFEHAVTGILNFGGPGDAVPVGSGVDKMELDLEEILFTNLRSLAVTPVVAATPVMELESVSSPNGALNLHVVSPVTDSLVFERGHQVDSSTDPGSSDLDETIDPQQTKALTLGAERNWNSGAADRTNLYRLKTGAGGASFWLPVSALQSDLQQPGDLTPVTPAASVAGLWAGEVTVNAATSIVTPVSSVKPSAGSVPLRLLLHSNAAGTVRLLSQVTIMQTKTADPAVPPVPVLVLDPARIPFFEGIRERGGKRVGIRLEAVAYDMPRKLDATSQAALLADDATYPDLTADGLLDFLIARKTRPPLLEEVYSTSWPLTGALGAGKTVNTSDAPLTLDPFHRSNPFRHAYHQNLPRGPHITRSFEIVFDPDQPITDRLRGTFSESITGLVKDTLTLTGRVEFRRVSTVATLEGAQ